MSFDVPPKNGSFTTIRTGYCHVRALLLVTFHHLVKASFAADGARVRPIGTLEFLMVLQIAPPQPFTAFVGAW